MLDTWFPEPQLGGGAPGEPGTRMLGPNEGPPELAAAAGRDERRGVRSVAVLTVIGSLAERAGGRARRATCGCTCSRTG